MITPYFNLGESEDRHWKAFKTGDTAAFSHLYQQYSAGLYNYGAKFSRDKDLIKDCIQELFVQIWTSRNSIGNPGHIKNYLYKSFRNLILRKVSQLQKNSEFDEAEDYEFSVCLNIEEALIDDENRKHICEQLQLTLSGLTARQREAIFLKFYEQLSYEEIAEVMGITVKASYKIMARSLNFLRENLSKEDLLVLYFVLNLKLIS
ncbi:RNA polymerase sigma factor [Pedobacter sp. JCM 36344]|uniref:RNA polymerase sigma factor n=1 Tax=Pedobacter sp. JCM 36344 TaxID=3374280 RepID=UPI003978F7DA